MAVFGGSASPTILDFLKIVNASPQFTSELSQYLSTIPAGISVANILTDSATNSSNPNIGGQTDPESMQISVAYGSPLNSSDPLRSAGYNFAETIAHELSRFFDPNLTSDGIKTEAIAELNSYALMSQASKNLLLISNGSPTLSASGHGYIFRPNPANENSPFGLTKFPQAEQLISEYLKNHPTSQILQNPGSAPSDLIDKISESIDLQSPIYKKYTNKMDQIKRFCDWRAMPMILLICQFRVTILIAYREVHHQQK